MKRVAGRAVAGLFVALLMLLALEGAVRVGMTVALPWFAPTAAVRDYVASNRIVYDAQLGWRPAAIDGVMDTEALGLGIRGLPPQPPPGRKRGFAFGDSQTQGGGVRPEESYPSVAEALLRRRGLDVEIINAGTSGYRSQQILQLLETRVLAWHPDFLLIDCRTRDSPRLDRNHGARADRVAALLFSSRLYRLLRLGVALARGEDVGLPSTEKYAQPLGDDQDGLGNHAEIVALARTWGVDVVFVDYPYMRGDEVILSGLEAGTVPADVPVVPATAALLATGRRSDQLFQDRNHLTVAGNVVVAEAVADVLEARLR